MRKFILIGGMWTEELNQASPGTFSRIRAGGQCVFTRISRR
jgi:hypothetical protein